MSRSIEVLHSVFTLSKAAGGLSVAVAELCGELAAQGAGVEILTEQTPDPQRVDLSDHVGLIEVAGRGYGQALEARQERSAIPILHQHGIWTAISRSVASFARERSIPYVVSPHGMLEPWALQYHGLRKKVAMTLYQRRNLQDASVLLATSEQEAANLRDLGLKPPIAVLPNGIQPVEGSPVDFAQAREKEVLFLSRIHPKKGLPMLLEAWAELKPQGWKLIIAGNDEGGHQAEVQQLADRLGMADAVDFPGPLYGEAKDRAFRRASFFVLPTYSENFGVVVGEALQYGLPVITTTGTPWKLLAEQDCGWWVEPETAAIRGALAAALGISAAERQVMGERGASLVEMNFRWPGVARELLCVYQWLLEASGKPDCVLE